MCGRSYQTYTDEELEIRYSTESLKRHPLGRRRPTYNLCPTQYSPVVLIRDKKRVLEEFRWGLVPLWAKDVKSTSKYSLINAKIEEITEKRSFASPFRLRRCIIPISGFYEWKPSSVGAKTPYAIYQQKHEILSLAGIWEKWISKETGEIVESFALLTTAANGFMKSIHSRMPVILTREMESEWLDPDLQDPQKILALIKPSAEDLLAAHRVSTKVNSPRNNDKSILQEVPA